MNSEGQLEGVDHGQIARIFSFYSPLILCQNPPYLWPKIGDMAPVTRYVKGTGAREFIGW
jgi:hypothetical protein